MKIAIVMGSLSIGGAERQFAILARGLAERGHDVRVVTMVPAGDATIEALLGNVHRDVLLPRAWPGPLRLVQLLRAWRRLKQWLERDPVDVVYSALEWPNWLSCRAAASMRTPPAVVIGLRSAGNKPGTRLKIPIRLLARTKQPGGIIANTEAAIAESADIGVVAPQEQVIFNGIDTERFCLNTTAGQLFRSEHKIGSDAMLIGHVGRLVVEKDHETLLHAMALIYRHNTKAVLICIGDGLESRRQSLQGLASTLGIQKRVRWVDRCEHMTAAYNAMNVLVLCSIGEGFPNVVAEAMACGTPAVVTSAGASGMIVGETGAKVTIGDRQAIAEAALAVASDEPVGCCRDRIMELFSVSQLLEQTESMLHKVRDQSLHERTS